MAIENPVEYKAYKISATATEIKVGEHWQGSYAIQKDDEVIQRATLDGAFASVDEAEQEALAFAQKAIDGQVPGAELKSFDK